MLSSLILHKNNEPFLNPIVMFPEKWILYDNQRQLVCMRRHPKALPKAKLPPKKKVTVTVWWSAAPLIHYNFLNPGETLTSEKHAQQINELHQKLQWLSSGCWSAEWAQFFSTTMPYCTLHNQCFRSWMNWTVKFCLICHVHLTSCQLTTTSSISTIFCRKNASTTSKMQERLSKSSSNPKAQIFMLQK